MFNSRILALSVCIAALSAPLTTIAADPQQAVTVAADNTWRNPDAPTAERVKSLMSQLTLQEKISLIHYLAPAIPRLGIRAYDHGNDGLHGLLRPGKNTVFPEAIGLAATFDPAAIHAMTTAVSDEARARWNATGGEHQKQLYSDVLTMWDPVVNMARDPRWGRTQETYGEDPWLTSRMGVAWVKGMQGDDPHYIKAIATPKHFAGNNDEYNRFGKNIVADPRYLREYEFPGFKACVQEGKAESVMSAYTAINGVPSSANKWLLTDVLRKQWGFKGYVVSDCGAVSNVTSKFHYAAMSEQGVADCLNAGLDMECDNAIIHYLPNAIKQGLVKPEVIEQAAALVLTGRFKLGMYDPPERVPYSKIPLTVIGSPEHLALARKLAEESIVLLQNLPLASGKPLLPIDTKRVKKIVLVGPYAEIAQFGDYSGTPPTPPVTPFAGIKARAEKEQIAVSVLPWANNTWTVVPPNALKPAKINTPTGLAAEYFATADLSGKPMAERVDQQLNFDWSHIEPDPLAQGKEFSVRWSGQVMAVSEGVYTFSIAADGGYRLLIDNKPVIDQWKQKSGKRFVVSGKTTLIAGTHTVQIEYHHNGGDTGLVWSWQTPEDAEKNLQQLKDADLVIAVVGLNTGIEIEGKDRKTLNLPADQEAFLKKAAAANPHLAVVLEGGSSIAIPWLSANAPAILDAWYPGQEGGNAIADVLFGDTNPSGRLPLTFYASDSQLRPMNEYDITKGRTYMYLKEKPLYAFGYGLSYTTFKYSNVKLSKSEATTNDEITATVDVTNTGNRDGAEVVQCYVHAQKSSVPMPIRQLWAFQRVEIPKGETKTVTLTLHTKDFGHWDEAKQQFVVEPGKFDIEVGAASDDIRASGIVDIMDQ